MATKDIKGTARSRAGHMINQDENQNGRKAATAFESVSERREYGRLGARCAAWKG